MALTVTLALAALVGQNGPAPLAPAGNWQIDYAATHCALTRTFGAGGQTVSMGLIPMTGSKSVKIALIASDPQALTGEGNAQIIVQPAPPPSDKVPTYIAYPDPNGGSAAFLQWLGPAMDSLAGAQTMTIKLGGREIAFDLKGMAKALAALKACELDLLARWGVDADKVETRPTLINPDGVVKDSDYPREAAQAHHSGLTTFRVIVDVEGNPADCLVIDMSGYPDLDARACSVVMKRARFVPAKDKEGQPVKGIFITSIRWYSPPIQK